MISIMLTMTNGSDGYEPDDSRETALAERRTAALAIIPIDPDSPEFERTATHMAREFTEATAEIARLVEALRVQTERLDAAFRKDTYSRFDLDLYYSGRRYGTDRSSITSQHWTPR